LADVGSSDNHWHARTARAAAIQASFSQRPMPDQKHMRKSPNKPGVVELLLQSARFKRSAYFAKRREIVKQHLSN
jgi:hypothetical protein